MNMQCTIKDFAMSFDFSNINPINKAQASYKDGSGMGGGGMYFRQGKKRKDEPDEDMFERSEDKNENDIDYLSEVYQEYPDTLLQKANHIQLRHLQLSHPAE